MINLNESLLWIESMKSKDNGSGKIDISYVEFMLRAFDQDCEFSIFNVPMWHPDEKYICVTEEVFQNADGDCEQKNIRMHFDSIDAMQTMYDALGMLLKSHYEKQLAKLQ